MKKFNNKEEFKDNKEVYALLTELETACERTDTLAPLAVHVLLGKLKTLNITFKAEEINDTIAKKELTDSPESSTIN